MDLFLQYLHECVESGGHTKRCKANATQGKSNRFNILKVNSSTVFHLKTFKCVS